MLNSEPKKRHLANVSLVAVATTEVEATALALEYSVRHLSFDQVLLFSHFNPKPGPTCYEHIPIQPFGSVGDWGKFVVFDLHQHIRTDHIILIHADGFIVNPQSWTEEFLEYDYIGAPWPIPKDNYSYRDHFGNIIRVGNSVSLRSKKILQLPSKLGLDWSSADHGYFHEDGFLCVQSRHILQAHGISYAPLSVACQFSREKTIPENRAVEPFAFHKWEGANRKYPRYSPKASLKYQVRKAFKKLMQRRA
jgi:hypothetical protein